jgi:hypothetical protein
MGKAHEAFCVYAPRDETGSKHYADDKLCHGDIAHFRNAVAVITHL